MGPPACGVPVPRAEPCGRQSLADPPCVCGCPSTAPGGTAVLVGDTRSHVPAEPPPPAALRNGGADPGLSFRSVF